jgi:Alpha galactosidase A
VGNSWRTTDDIQANWNSVLECLDNTVGLARFAGHNAWNDPDMLEVGPARQFIGFDSCCGSQFLLVCLHNIVRLKGFASGLSPGTTPTCWRWECPAR